MYTVYTGAINDYSAAQKKKANERILYAIELYTLDRRNTSKTLDYELSVIQVNAIGNCH